MTIQITIPEWTESTAEEGFIANWFVGSGTHVRAGQVLGELMVEKATLEIPAPQDGVIQNVLVHRGDVVKPGTVVAELASADEALPAATTAPAATSAAPAAASTPGGFVPASPAARRMARDLGVDLAQVTPADGQRITEEDVRRAAAGSMTATAAPAHPDGVTSVPLSGRRKVTAERMLRSVQQSAQLTLTTEARADALVAARDRCRQRLDLSITDMVAWLVVRALQQHPEMNATLEGETLRRHAAIHLGLAVAVADGLLVPVLRDAGALSLEQLAAQAHALTERARTGACTPAELSGSTFSLTNLGTYDVDAFTPILNPPEIGILGVGRIREAIVPRDGQPALGYLMALSLTFDHRAIDGAPAAAFLQSLKRLIEAPATYEGIC
jgi:pyruvate dehydrogenase E2 component (dihydrolipoamide acetyltransferase)